VLAGQTLDIFPQTLDVAFHDPLALPEHYILSVIYYKYIGNHADAILYLGKLQVLLETNGDNNKLQRLHVIAYLVSAFAYIGCDNEKSAIYCVEGLRKLDELSFDDLQDRFRVICLLLLAQIFLNKGEYVKAFDVSFSNSESTKGFGLMG
jgi:hypothetical protein